ncbi:MAG: UDP-N-acetylmuramoyl-L-alanine--D-glutamate ligase [Ruminococcus sp.]|jgi:UDP-N-acetylmuramoylalanine--D-glutamate ligase|nr:UDP-N-acetylmuramoyl-L-alanine--D-glutamate ligase [Ruminococcus sp.]
MNADRFFENIKKNRIAVIGTGVSHRELIPQFLKKGFDLTFLDKRSEIAEYDEYKDLGAKFILGEHYLDSLTDFDIVFRTPGMYFGNPKLREAVKKGVAVTSELEVFFSLCPCKTYAVTGSDGKTTTTTLIAEMLSAEGKTVHKGGNLGKALLPIIGDIKETDIVVCELSSFQLMSMRTSPDVAVITNISPNHLDVHGTMNEYINCKKNILLHQNAFGKAVLNLDNADTAALSEIVRGKCTFFSRQKKPEIFGAFLDDQNNLCYNKNGSITAYVNAKDIKIPGVHNVENYLAAIAAVEGEVSPETVKKVARDFGGVEHRIEFVREIDGVKYYNDSIATSPTRTIAGLRSFGRKIIVIAGGYDKKIPYEPLAEDVNKYVKCLVTLGATAPKIEDAVRGFSGYDENECKIIRVETLEEAVEAARREAKPGDVISLSPASASFDLYKNFEERGAHFKKIVNGLE